MTTKLLLTPEEVAAELGIGRTRVFSLIKSGELQSLLLGKKSRRVSRSALEAYVLRLESEQIEQGTGSLA